MIRKVLIVTSEMDTTADVMVRCLTHRSVPFERLHTADFPTRLMITGSVDGSDKLRGGITGPSIRTGWEEIGSVWFRRPGPFEFSDDLTDEEREFAFHESTAVVNGIWRCLDVLWVNHPDRIRIAESKVLQLQLAAELGAVIPRTLFTNNPQELRDFYDALDGRIIFKTMTQGVLGRHRQQSIYATRLTADTLGTAAKLQLSPCQFQEEVRKHCDLRITVIGAEVFAVEIHPPADSSPNVDWRAHSGPDLKHLVHDLPDAQRRFCLDLTERLHLNFAAIDMILSDEGRYVFLEINPNGQFGWLETVTDLRLTDALADVLSSPMQ